MKKFSDPPNTAVFTTRFVMKEKKDILFVSHDREDGAWQFLSEDKIDRFEEVAMIVALQEIVKTDNTLLEVADLPMGCCAMRKKKGGKWKMQELK